MRKSKLFLLLLLFTPLVSQAETLTVDASRLVKIQGVVAPGLLSKAEEIVALSDESTKPIFIALNGPGGMVGVSKIIINAMDLARSRGTPLICFTSVMAMSATFNMMMHCSERYALKSAMFLFHPVRSNGMFSLRALDALAMAKAMHAIDTEILFDIKNLMKPRGTDEDILRNYYQETQWHAEDLAAFAGEGWLHVVDDIRGSTGLMTFLTDNGFRDISRTQEVIGIPMQEEK
jgi:ATP-dependent protease ClpP protease subunit